MAITGRSQNLASAPKPQEVGKGLQEMRSPYDELRGSVQAMGPQFKHVLPPHITPEKFIRVAMTAVQLTPALLNADRKSFFSACMKAAQDGLLPDGREAALVPYTSNGVTTVNYVPMVGGILKKVRNSGELASITSQIVFKNDQFRYWIDEQGEHLMHDPQLFGDRGQAIGVYALATTKDGAMYVEVMTTEQVMAVRQMSKAKNGPWSGPFEHEMWRKTAIRRLSKRLPMSTDIEQVVSADYESEETARVEKDLDEQPLEISGPHVGASDVPYYERTEESARGEQGEEVPRT